MRHSRAARKDSRHKGHSHQKLSAAVNSIATRKLGHAPRSRSLSLLSSTSQTLSNCNNASSPPRLPAQPLHVSPRLCRCSGPNALLTSESRRPLSFFLRASGDGRMGSGSRQRPSFVFACLPNLFALLLCPPSYLNRSSAVHQLTLAATYLTLSSLLPISKKPYQHQALISSPLSSPPRQVGSSACRPSSAPSPALSVAVALPRPRRTPRS